ncbi:MAG: hypothetical protein JO071_05510 [Deltaproteobacteria bacterium]|nr:hypothetical protein [Deltaproteobacteria bacterium]
MPDTESFLAQELTKFFEAAWLDLPAEAGKILLGVGDQKQLRKAGWKAYDAWISLANEFTNTVYSDPIIGGVTGQVMESVLRLRQIGGAVAAASFSNLWPAIGLPTHSEMAAVRDELLTLREELATYAARLPVSGDAAGMDAQGTARASWKIPQLNGYRAKNGTGSAIHRSANQGKRHVAAQ